jgi:hypothetical protein
MRSWHNENMGDAAYFLIKSPSNWWHMQMIYWFSCMNRENGNHYSTIFNYIIAQVKRRCQSWKNDSFFDVRQWPIIWQQLLENFKEKWHDKHSPYPLIYLGYPVHHNEQQPTCLSVYTAIQNPTTRIDFERQKLLHSRPIIDSKLAPIFQIVTHPPRDKCTKKLDKVCPHGYGPSWRTNPKDKGGAAVINVQQQSNALLLTFLQACAKAGSGNIIPPLVTSSFRAHTGQASLITLSSLPNERSYLLEKVRPLKNLARVLTSRPPLSISKYWPSHLLSQIPLRCLVQQPLQPNSYTRIDLSTTVGDLRYGTRTVDSSSAKLYQLLHKSTIDRSIFGGNKIHSTT